MVATAIAAVATLGACGADGDAFTPTREYAIGLRAEERGDGYGYVAEDALDLRVGDRVTFEMRNDGDLIHDLVVVHPDGRAIATGPAIAAGASLDLVVDFVDAGIYRLNCNVDDHLTVYGMQELVQVAEAS